MLKQKCIGCILFVTISAMFSVVFGASEKTVVPLFLFSGQSNMVCLGSSVSDLPSDDKNMSFENIKIHNRSDGAKSGWETLKPGFGGDRNHFGPELYFGKKLAEAMPDTKFAFIKDASSGTYLGQSGNTWLPPSSGGPGTLYANMMTHIENALKDFNDAFDTSEYTPRWAGFVWHQGEFDAWNNQSLAQKYEENLTNLIHDIREMAEDDSMPAIIPMITGGMWQHLNIVRAAEIAVAEKVVNADTMDTDGYALSGDGVHFNAASQIKIGTICAERWLDMEYTKEWWKTPVVYQSNRQTSPLSFAPSNIAIFDLSGRKIAPSTYGGRLHSKSTISPQILIQRATSEAGKNKMLKIIEVGQ